MTFKPDISIVDINALGYAAMYTPQGSLSYEGFPTGGLRGALSSLATYMTKNPQSVPLVVWDSHCDWRLQILPGYKLSRKSDEGKLEVTNRYRKQVPYIQELLMLMGVPQLSCHDAEADDLAGIIMRHMPTSWLIEMLTRDTDWAQSLDHRSTWLSPFNENPISLQDLADPEKTLKDGPFASPWVYLQSKALAGDKSDDIPGVDGVGLKTANKHIMGQGNGEIREFWRRVDAGEIKPKGVILERLASQESREMFERNLKMMDWRCAPPVEMARMSLTAGKPDWVMVKMLCEQFGLDKLVSRLQTAMKPWEQGWGVALDAIDSAVNHHICQPVHKPGFEQSSYSMELAL